MRTVSLKEANQQFSKLIQDVERGETVVITRRGKPVARLSPQPENKMDDPEWRAAYERMVAAMEEGIDLGGLQIKDRDELYDRQ